MLTSVYSKSGIMKLGIYFVTVFGIFGIVSSIPDCLKSNKTCPLDTKHFSLAPVSLTTWGKCRDECNALENCTSFTFFDSRGVPFKRMCFLFTQKCLESDLITCEGCYSGYQCNYCSVEGLAFSMDGKNLIKMLAATNEETCREQCSKDKSCAYYTINFGDSNLMPNTCILMSASSSPEVCKSCRTGPKACNFGATCKPNEAVIMSSTPATFQKFETNVTVKIETMGCSAKANVLAIGGGGTGGYSYNGYYYGGGGSGFLKHSSTFIPFTKIFSIFIGQGGKDIYNDKYNQYQHRSQRVTPTQQSTSSPPFSGQLSMVVDENEDVIIRAQGGEGGYSTAGGNGFSGGGSAWGQNGGNNGSDGGSSSQYKGGCGSGIDIERDVQPLFRKFHLDPAAGNNGSTSTSSSAYGGGGGGVFVNGRNYSYGQGGDGEGSRIGNGNSGVVLLEILF